MTYQGTTKQPSVQSDAMTMWRNQNKQYMDRQPEQTYASGTNPNTPIIGPIRRALQGFERARIQRRRGY